MLWAIGSTPTREGKLAPLKVEKFFHNLRVGGHRGSPTKQPENTLESMEQAKVDGVDIVEFDVSLTRDGIALLLHDDTLDRTTNFTGPIRSYLHEELRLCNPGAKFYVDAARHVGVRLGQ